MLHIHLEICEGAPSFDGSEQAKIQKWEHKEARYLPNPSRLPLQSQHTVQVISCRRRRILGLDDDLVAKGLEGQSVANKVLAHRFDPVETERVQHGAGALHDDEHGDGDEEPHVEADDDHDHAQRARHCERVAKRHAPQHDAKLLVSQR
jgi:hypothetical protein